MSLRDQKEQRKRWRIKQRKRREKLKELKKIDDYIIGNSPPESRLDTPIYERERMLTDPEKYGRGLFKFNVILICYKDILCTFRSFTFPV